MEGLRARKKQQSRQRIAAAAARLFKRRGYESVRMVDIARAADVAEQTVYNYFPTKEHLIFDRDQEFEARIIGVVLRRRPGTSLAEAVRAASIQFLNEASHSVGKPTGIPAYVAMGPALRRVWVEMNARHSDSLTRALTKDRGAKMPAAAAKVLARSIVAIFAVILEELSEGAMAGKSRAQMLRELRAAVRFIMDGVERGLNC
jgi:AcrR family transcriptional regulator